jgi:hypothetical protein
VPIARRVSKNPTLSIMPSSEAGGGPTKDHLRGSRSARSTSKSRADVRFASVLNRDRAPLTGDQMPRQSLGIAPGGS